MPKVKVMGNRLSVVEFVQVVKVVKIVEIVNSAHEPWFTAQQDKTPE
jgi:hypothetical protein